MYILQGMKRSCLCLHLHGISSEPECCDGVDFKKRALLSDFKVDTFFSFSVNEVRSFFGSSI